MSLTFKNLTKTFTSFDKNIDVLKSIDLDLEEGSTVAILGQSGSGKSTLLSLIAGLDHPTSGSVWISDQNLTVMNEEKLTRYRAENLGIIFQQFHLMPHLSALENVQLPLELTGQKDAEKRAKTLLNEVGLSEREQHFPSQLSGGEQQRVAIARALSTGPKLLLADEPTGNLDEATGGQIIKLLFDMVKKSGATLILVTHNLELAQACGRQFNLSGGKLNEVMG